MVILDVVRNRAESIQALHKSTRQDLTDIQSNLKIACENFRYYSPIIDSQQGMAENVKANNQRNK